MDKAKKVLDTFYLAFGAQINWHKSCVIWVAKMEQKWHWGQDFDLRWVAKGEGMKYLGVQIGFRFSTRWTNGDVKKEAHFMEQPSLIPSRKGVSS